MTDDEQHPRHVRNERATRERWKLIGVDAPVPVAAATGWCGEVADNQWFFTSPQHVLLYLANGAGAITPCPDCLRVMRDILDEEIGDACERCDGDGEVSHGSCSVPDCEHADQCPVCGGAGKRPTDDQIAALRTDRDVTDAELAVARAEIAAYKERDRERPHPFDERAAAAELAGIVGDAIEASLDHVAGRLDEMDDILAHEASARGMAAAQRALREAPRRWRDVPGDPIRAVAERVLANAGADGLPPHANNDARAIATWVMGKTRPDPGTST